VLERVVVSSTCALTRASLEQAQEVYGAAREAAAGLAEQD